MKLITRGAFKLLQGEVLYSHYQPQSFHGFEIKLENSGRNDWVADSLDAGSVETLGDSDLCDKMYEAERRANDPDAPHLPMDFEYSGRDGLFDSDDSLIAIYSEDDILKLAARLVRLLPNHELVAKPVEAKQVKVACSQRAFQIKTIGKSGELWVLSGEAVKDRAEIPQQIYDVWKPVVGGWVDLEPVPGITRGSVGGYTVVYRDELVPNTVGDFDGDQIDGAVTLAPNDTESEITRMRKIHSDAVIDPNAPAKSIEEHVAEVEKFLRQDSGGGQ